MFENLGPRAEPVYSKIQDTDGFRVWGVYRKLENLGSRAESVYSKNQSPGRLLVPSVYKILEKPGSGQNLYTQKFRARAGSWLIVYTESSKSPGPGRNLYTQIFWIQAGSWLLAYTESSKSLDSGRICILKFSGPGQAPDHWRIQKVRKAWISAGSVYSNFQGLGKLLVAGEYNMLKEPEPRAKSVYSKNSGLEQVPSPGRIQKAQKIPGPGRLQID